MTHPNLISVGLIQLQCSADPDANLRQAIAQVRVAAARGAQVICLPELFRSLYFCQSEDFDQFASAEEVPGPTTIALGELAAELGVVLIAGLFERRGPGLYHNTAVVLDADGRYLGKYRKMHIPDDPLFYEKFYFTPGDLGFPVFDTRFGRLSVLICWDQWFPEAARLAALGGAEMIFYPTAIGWLPAQKAASGAAQVESWELIQRAHAVANGCYVVSVNRTGHEGDPAGGLEFWGRSFVAGPNGMVLGQAAVGREEVVVVALDLAQVDQTRIRWPFLRDRRIEAYGDLTQRYLDSGAR